MLTVENRKVTQEVSRFEIVKDTLKKSVNALNRRMVTGILVASAAFGGVYGIDNLKTDAAEAIEGKVTVLPNCPPDYDSRPGEVVRWGSPGIMSSTVTGDIIVRNSVVEGKNQRVKHDNDGSTGMLVISRTGTTAETPFGSDIQPCVANNKVDQPGEKNKLRAAANAQLNVLLNEGCVGGAGCSSVVVYQEKGRDSRGRKIYNEQQIRHAGQLQWVIPQGK